MQSKQLLEPVQYDLTQDSFRIIFPNRLLYEGDRSLGKPPLDIDNPEQAKWLKDHLEKVNTDMEKGATSAIKTKLISNASKKNILVFDIPKNDFQKITNVKQAILMLVTILSCDCVLNSSIRNTDLAQIQKTISTSQLVKSPEEQLAAQVARLTEKLIQLTEELAVERAARVVQGQQLDTLTNQFKALQKEVLRGQESTSKPDGFFNKAPQ